MTNQNADFPMNFVENYLAKSKLIFFSYVVNFIRKRMILVIMVKYEYKVYEKLYHESLQKNIEIYL